jgi:hypothetical protein
MNKKMNRSTPGQVYFTAILWIAFMLLALPAVSARAAGTRQQAELTIGLRRDFGYSSGGGQIQGTFSFRSSGPDDLARVIYYIDGSEMGEATQAPFNLKFNTDIYPLGAHTLSAKGYTTSGRELQSNELHVEFVSADEGWKAAMRIAGPIVLITFAGIALSLAFTFISGRKLKDLPAGTQRNYGVHGGAICPRCGRPFARHLFAPNMITGKLERCPFCGKWSIVAAASPQALRAAEQAELQAAGGALNGESDEQKLKKEVDESRYQDL